MSTNIKDVNDNKKLYNSLKERFDSLVERRKPNDALRWEALSYVGHRLKGSSDPDCPTPDTRLYSAAGVRAFNRFADGFMGNVMSRNIRWFATQYEDPLFQDSDDIEGANEYFSKADQRMYSELDRSNFYPESMIAFKDSVATGSSAMFVQNDTEDKICCYRTVAPWRWWADVNKYGTFDTFFYRYWLTNDKFLDEFGETAPETLVKAAKKNPFSQDKKEIIQCIYPRNNFYPNSKISTRKKFACVYIDVTDACVVKESGFDQFPVIIHVYDRSGDDIYGTGLVMAYISEFRKLNRLAYDFAFALRMAGMGMWAVPNSMVDKFMIQPEAVLPYTSSDQIPIRTDREDASVQYQLQALNEQIDLVNSLLYNDMFTYMMQQTKVYTATQVNAVRSEELSLLAAVFGNTQKQKIEKSLRLTFYLMAKNGRIETPPKEILKNMNMLNFSLNSVLAQSLQAYSQKDANLANLETASTFASLGLTEPLDNYDFDYICRAISRGSGADARSMKSKRAVQEIRAYRQQQQEAQMQNQMALNQSEMVRNLRGGGASNNPTGVNQAQ